MRIVEHAAFDGITRICLAQPGTNMEAVKIIMPAAERKACVCGATLQISRSAADKRKAELWLCSRHCGARGVSYEDALPA